MSIAFIDLQAQRRRLGGKIEAAMMAAVESGAYVMGPPVREFEQALAAFGGAKHALGCANGTEALALPLMAWGLRPGDAVFVPSFTFCATAEVVPWLGATPVFIDIDPRTYNIDPGHLEAAIEATIAEGKLKPKVVIAVDLFGQPADYPAIKAICDKHGLKLIADSAQGFGCTINGEHPLKWADVTTTSFFPAKPLGCYGDGGAVLTDDDDLAQEIDSYRVHGKAVAKDLVGRTFEHDTKYLNMRVGMNSRLDTRGDRVAHADRGPLQRTAGAARRGGAAPAHRQCLQLGPVHDRTSGPGRSGSPPARPWRAVGGLLSDPAAPAAGL